MDKKKNQKEPTPIGHAIDVEYSAELADEEDLKANARAAAANRRAVQRDLSK